MQVVIWSHTDYSNCSSRQRWNGFDLPTRQYGFGIYRSARLDSPQYHQWAMAEILQCGDDEPSTVELIVLASWMLKSMSNKRQALADGVEQLNAFHSGANFPVCELLPIFKKKPLYLFFAFENG